MPLTLTQMLALFPDNTAGDISAEDGRDVITGLYELSRVSPPSTGWSWVNQGSATISTEAEGHQKMTVASAGGNNLVARVRTAPATPYVIRALVTLQGNVVSFDGGGPCWRESSTGEITSMTYRPTSLDITAEDWTNPTTFSASLFDVNVPQVWWELEDNGTNLIIRVSLVGIKDSFVQHSSRSRTTFMAGGPDQVGFIARNDSSAFDVSLHSWEEL